MAKLPATATWDPQDEPFTPVKNTQALDEPKLLASSPSCTHIPCVLNLRAPNQHAYSLCALKTPRPLTKILSGKEGAATPSAVSKLRDCHYNLTRNGGVYNGGGNKDLSQVTCYNRRKRGHYAKNCPEPQDRRLKMLTTVLATSTSIVKAHPKPAWECVLCIQYSAQFRNNQVSMYTLFGFGSEVNATTPNYTLKLGLGA